jgi:phosphoglycerate dehydrogenase-like enzyme
MKTKVAVLDDYDCSISKLNCWDILGADFQIDFFSIPKVTDELSDYQVIVTIRERTIVTRDFLDRAKNLQHLAVTGRLSGQADLQALSEKGITASYTDGSGSSAAELTIALILGVTKGIHFRHVAVQSGHWQIGPASNLSGKTLGILGLGRIGTKVAQFGKLMDMNVISWGPSPDQGRQEKYGILRLELAEVMKNSDVVAVCLRLSEKTKGILGPQELALLKDSACLVNTSRAEIIQKSALYAELKSARISGAFDVFYEEPLPADDPIRTLPNVLLSPHMGYVTHEVYEKFFSQVVENILAWKNGHPYRNALERSS